MFKSWLVMPCVNVSQVRIKFSHSLFTNLEGFFIRNHALINSLKNIKLTHLF